jgi:hypothetical protein
MTKHTPGPWALRAQADRLEVFPVNELGLRPTLATIAKWSREGVNESNANARLIAAAPDLLAACLEVAQGYTTRGSEMARAAIAKATGEQP